MDATTAQPTLMSAARNFIRKSAGTAVLAIAPLAAVSVAPEAKAQTFFSYPTVSTNSTGDVTGSGNNFSGGIFSFSGGLGANNIQIRRNGTSGYFYTESGSGTNVNVTLSLFSTISGDTINATTIIPVAYDFTLTKQAGSIGNVSWMLHAEIPGDDSYVIGSGTLTTSSATFTGSGNYTVLNNVPGDSLWDFKVYLTLSYSPVYQQQLAVIMNSGSQGFTINAAAIPEPTTYAMIIGLGALGVVIVRRSRRSRAA